MAGNSIDDPEIRDLDGSAASQSLPRGVRAGSLVFVRGCRWRLDTCVARQDCQELHLRDSAGARRVLLWPFDRPVATASGGKRLRVVSLSRWARCAGAVLARTLDPETPRGAFRGEILPYQLAPVAAMASGAARVLLADEVGLGKTIQAGWILSDLFAREPEARALVAVPASLREQWWTELNAFFALAAARVDAAWLRAAVAERPSDVSPWAAPGAYLGSIDFLKRADVARSIADVTWDLLVVDEAHSAAAPTERYVALARIASVSRRIVIVTATPYSGDTAGFASIMALGGFAREPDPLMFRRSRDDVGDPRRRRHRFAMVRISGAESRLQRLLGRYTRDVWRNATAETERARLAMTILRKRSLSSPAAALRSLTRRLELLQGAVPSPQQLSLFDDAEPDDVLPEAALAAPGFADAGLEGRWLTALIEAASQAIEVDSKERYLLRLLSRVRGEAVIVFTEYRDTLRRLAGALPEALQLHGGLVPTQRSEVQRAFNEAGGILLATDAAADGLNLQRRCRVLVNYELPWNPARLEQRIGRVDRIGQRRTVHAVSLVARDTAEDLVVASLARRLARVAVTLGERDRLAAFLTDAQTARSVIGGEPLEAIDPGLTTPFFCRPLPDAYPVHRIAAQLTSRASAGEAAGNIVVAAIRGRPPLEPGYVVVVIAAAVTDRGVVARHPIVLQVHDAPVSRPGSHRQARQMAVRAAASAERAARSLPQILEWFADRCALHRRSVRSTLAREEALRRSAGHGDEMQPGLFDRRAIADMEQRITADAGRATAHQARLTTLRAALDVRLECSAAAVLIVWR